MPFAPTIYRKVGAKILTFDHVLNQAPIGMALLSLNGVYEAVNDAYCTILGCQQEELLDKRFALIVPTEADRQIRSTSPDSTDKDSTLQGEQPIMRRDGSLSHISFQSVSVWGIDGLHRHLVFATDITQLKQTQDKLRQVESRSQTPQKNHSRPLLREPFRPNTFGKRIGMGSSQGVKMHAASVRRGSGLKHAAS